MTVRLYESLLKGSVLCAKGLDLCARACEILLVIVNLCSECLSFSGHLGNFLLEVVSLLS